MNDHQTNGAPEFILAYEFDAPKELVFDAFGNAEALNEWWGPVETNNSVIRLDFRPGGIFHFKMEAGGNVNYGRFLFGRIEPHYLLEFTNAFADEHANVVRPPFDIPLPLEIFYRLVFAEHNGKTTITLSGKPVNGSPEEVEGFLAIGPNMQEGFGATFDELSRYLNKQKAI